MRQQSGGRRPRNRPNRKQQVSPRIHNFDSQGPEGRVRGNAPQVYEKYMSLARDATSSGDRIVAESYYQFAEHYYRIMNETTDPERPGLDPARQAREQPRVPCEPEHGWGNGRGTEQPRPAQAEVDGTPMRASVPRPLDSARPLEPAGRPVRGLAVKRPAAPVAAMTEPPATDQLLAEPPMAEPPMPESPMPESSAAESPAAEVAPEPEVKRKPRRRLKVGNGAARRTAKGQEPEPSDPADGGATEA
jgi:hypothetical protein